MSSQAWQSLKTTFQAQSQQSGPQKSFKRYDGPIYLPPQILNY